MDQFQRPIILFIDDEPAILETYGQGLKLAGLEVRGISQAKEGLETAKQIKPALILLDIMMPHFDGFQFLQKLKEDPKLKNIPVVVLTNLSSDKDKKIAFKLGVLDYLVKVNYNPRELGEKIKEIISIEKQ